MITLTINLPELGLNNYVIETQTEEELITELDKLNSENRSENRVEQVIQPSYGISSSWKNQYHDEWVLKGGWK